MAVPERFHRVRDSLVEYYEAQLLRLRLRTASRTLSGYIALLRQAESAVAENPGGWGALAVRERFRARVGEAATAVLHALQTVRGLSEEEVGECMRDPRKQRGVEYLLQRNADAAWCVASSRRAVHTCDCRDELPNELRRRIRADLKLFRNEDKDEEFSARMGALLVNTEVALELLNKTAVIPDARRREQAMIVVLGGYVARSEVEPARVQ